MAKPASETATLHYGDGEFAVLKPGRTVICAVSGKAIPLDGAVTWSNSDIVGRRLRIGAVAGKSPPSVAGDASVSFLFGGNQVTSLYPGWDSAKTSVYSVEIQYVDPARNANRIFNLSGYPVQPPDKTLEAANGHIKGRLQGEFRQTTTSATGDTTKVPIVLTFDLVQPPL
ncbi:MAG: DUF2093 domain-containing protein [Candidatus Sericytochromatia bacterium]